jgi:ribonuclease P protein component
MIDAAHRLRKHADYQRVYRAGRKQFTRNMAYFYALRPAAPDAGVRGAIPARRDIQAAGAIPAGDAIRAPGAIQTHNSIEGPRVGLTVPKALGNAVVRNRIKRRMREAVRHALPLLSVPADLVLHPRRIVLDMDFAQLECEVANLFRSVQTACGRANGKDARATGKDARAAGQASSATSEDVPAKAKLAARAALP